MGYWNKQKWPHRAAHAIVWADRLMCARVGRAGGLMRRLLAIIVVLVVALGLSAPARADAAADCFGEDIDRLGEQPVYRAGVGAGKRYPPCTRTPPAFGESTTIR